MKIVKKGLALALCLSMTLPVCLGSASAKTDATGQNVETVFFYIINSAGQEILISQLPVSDMEAALDAGQVNNTLHNISVLDKYVTTVHQEAQGFTVSEFIDYAQSKSTVSDLRDLKLTFEGDDKIAFWELEDNGYDDADTYTWNDLYGEPRYNFPLLYQYWNYETQDYYDPEGVMTREEVIDCIFQNGEPESAVLSVRAFSQRYIDTYEKYQAQDYEMENYWNSQDKLDTERTIRFMMGMTKEDLYDKVSTAANNRFWNQSFLLDMVSRPQVEPLADVAAPTGEMYIGTDGNYYVSLDCTTEGAALYYNQNFDSASYMPTALYNGIIQIPADASCVKNGVVILTVCAVKDGCTDAGVQTLELTSSGTTEVEGWKNPFTDVSEADDWFYDSVRYVTEKGLFNGTTEDTFSPHRSISRAMLATVLYRMAGEPETQGITATPLTDVASSEYYADAVAWCYETGVVTGITDTTFSPDQNITREQLAAMLYRYADYIEKRDMRVTSTLSEFTDTDQISSYALDNIKWAVATGLITGRTNTTLAPKDTATRAEAAAMLQRFQGG